MTEVTVCIGVNSPKPLFSQTKTTGSFHTAARLSDSWKVPSLEAPSPKKQAVTSSRARDQRGQRRAGRDRQAGADDAVGAEDAEREIDDMHRAALALAVAGALAVELRHHAVEASALGDQMAVAAMGRGDAIGLAQRRAYAGRARLLADRDVDEAGDLVGDREVADLALELPNPLHRAIHLEQQVFAEVHR